MRYQQNAVLSSLRRAQQFLEANSAVLNGVNPTARKELDDVVAQLTTLSVAQDSGARGSKGETSRQRALRNTLRQNHMAPIAEVAKYKLHAVPEFAALMLPPANISAQSDVASAFAMADAATPHGQTFTDSGLSPAFLDDLRTAATAVSDSIVDRSNHQGRRNGATAGLAATEKRGRAMLRVLNALILARIGDSAQLRREWATAKAVQQKPGPAAGAHGTASTAGQSTGAPTPAPVPTLVPTSPPAATPSAPTPVAA